MSPSPFTVPWTLSHYLLTHCLPAPHPCFLAIPASWEEPTREGQGRVVALVMEVGTGSAAGLLTIPALPCRRETLQDVSFTVMPGQTLALVRGNPAIWPSRLHLPLFQCPW